MTDVPVEQTRERLARQFHEAYERLAPQYGWETQERSRVAWEDVPAENKALMFAVLDEVVLPEVVRAQRAEEERDNLRGMCEDAHARRKLWLHRAQRAEEAIERAKAVEWREDVDVNGEYVTNTYRDPHDVRQDILRALASPEQENDRS